MKPLTTTVSGHEAYGVSFDRAEETYGPILWCFDSVGDPSTDPTKGRWCFMGHLIFWEESDRTAFLMRFGLTD